jgi:hypothetical protein
MLLLAGCSRGDAVPAAQAATSGPLAQTAASANDWYPEDIAPPAGTQYPCALTALPRDLPGIPAADRRFINRAYSLILKATHAKLVLLKALEGTTDLEPALARYLEATGGLRDRLAGESVPEGLGPFRADVLEALDRQQAFFRAAVASRSGGATYADVFSHPDGRLASRRLISAWGRMQQRYPSWSPALRDSIYHHLCALDLF